MTNVIKFQAPFERLKEQSDLPADIALRRAIILQAIIDATNISNTSSAKKIEKDARDWIFNDDDNFTQICHEALLEPGYVQNLAKKIINLHYSNTQIKALARSEEIKNIYHKLSQKEPEDS